MPLQVITFKNAPEVQEILFVRSGLRFAAALGFGVELYGLLISFRWLVAQNVVDSHDADYLLHMIRICDGLAAKTSLQ